VEHQDVSVRIREVRHVAHAGVEGIAVECDPTLRELGARSLDIGDAQCDRRRVRRAELPADVRRAMR
jgi:hypothetical protein